MTPQPDQPTRTFVRLPPDLKGPFDVYLNGVRQQPEIDFRVEEERLVFQRPLRRDRIAGWRWFLGAWGIGTYRQNDSVDVRYEADGQPRLAQGLEMMLIDE